MTPFFRIGLVVLAGLVLACAAKQPFMHKQHRENFALQPDELTGLQFYVSTEVLAKNLSDASPEGVVVVPANTPGRVLEVGPNWLRVSFQKGGSGVYFMAPEDAPIDASYWLATRMAGQPGLQRLRDQAEPVLVTEAGEFRVVYGASARLLVDAGQLEKLMKERRHLSGQKAK